MREGAKDTLKAFLVVGLLILTVFSVIYYRNNVRMILIGLVVIMALIVAGLLFKKYRDSRESDTDSSTPRRGRAPAGARPPFFRRLQIFWSGFSNLILIGLCIVGIISLIAFVMRWNGERKTAKADKLTWYKSLEVMPRDREGRHLRDSTCQECKITENQSGFVMLCSNKYGTDQFLLPYGKEVGEYSRLNQRKKEDKVFGTFTIQKADEGMYLGRETTGTGKESSFVVLRSDRCKGCGK